MARAALTFLLLLPFGLQAQQDTTYHRVRPWAQFTLGSRTPGGFFSFGGGVELRSWAAPAAVFGLGGGPDGATIALGNEAWLWRQGRFGARGWAYWNHAFGREESDEFNSGYRTITEQSTSIKAGASFTLRTNNDMSVVLSTGYSWALNVPKVTVERPSGTTVTPSTDPYFGDQWILGASVLIWL